MSQNTGENIKSILTQIAFTHSDYEDLNLTLSCVNYFDSLISTITSDFTNPFSIKQSYDHHFYSNSRSKHWEWENWMNVLAWFFISGLWSYISSLSPLILHITRISIKGGNNYVKDPGPRLDYMAPGCRHQVCESALTLITISESGG